MTPTRVSVSRRHLFRSVQFGRASPPIVPHFVHTMRGLKRLVTAIQYARPHAVVSLAGDGHGLGGWGAGIVASRINVAL
jgi:hypothetical protein